MAHMRRPHADSDSNGRGSRALPFDLMALLAWTGSSLGVGGVLLGIGYLVYAGNADLLGVGGFALGPTEYVRISGRFGVELIRDYAAFIGDLFSYPYGHWGLLPPSAAIVAASAVAVWRLGPREGQESGRRASVALALLVLLFVVKTAWFDLPMLAINKVLLRWIDCSSAWDVPRPVRPMTAALWEDVVCSRAAVEPAIGLSGCGCSVDGRHDVELRTIFLAGSTCSFLLALTALRRARNDLAGRRFVVGVLLLSIAMANLAMVPFTFGKLRLPTRFDSGEVFVRNPDQSWVGPILSTGKEYVAVFDPLELAVITVPTSAVTRVSLSGSEDVIRTRMENQSEDGQAPPQKTSPSSSTEGEEP